MSRRSHLWIGILIGINVAFIAGAMPVLAILITVAVAAGSILPDVDMLYADKMPFNERGMLTSHRGWTHHPLIPVLIIIISLIFSASDEHLFSAGVLYVGIGIALHDALDMLSPLGVPSPLSFNYRKRVAVPVYITGDVSEYVLTGVITLVLMVPLFVFITNAHAQDRFNLKSIQEKYMNLKDNKTVSKYKYILKEASKNLNREETRQSALESYEYYKNNILPYVKKRIKKQFPGSSGARKPLLSSDSYIYIFMSSSVPESTWRNYIKAIDKLRRNGQDGIGLILRGCIGGCIKVVPTAKFIFRLLKHGDSTYKVPILIDPLLFRLFEIKSVPVIVYAKHVDLSRSWLSPGAPGSLKHPVDAYKVTGDCGLVYALQELYEQSGDGALLGLYNILTQGWFEK